MREKIAQFMYGRYGVDQLSRVLIGVCMVCVLISLFINSSILNLLTIILLVVAYTRIFSRNRQRRYEENVKYLQLQERVLNNVKNHKTNRAQQKLHCIFACPTCKQQVRVPRGKGKIEIKCPKCGAQFVKRS